MYHFFLNNTIKSFNLKQFDDLNTGQGKQKREWSMKFFFFDVLSFLI